jgi:hypothetical protein
MAGNSIGKLLGILLGSRVSSGADNARSERAQAIMNELIRAKGGTPVEPPEESPGVLSRIGRTIDPANVGGWLANLGPMPTGIDTSEEALAGIAGVGLPQSALAGYAAQISELKNRGARDGIASNLERQLGLEPGELAGADMDALDLGMKVVGTSARTGPKWRATPVLNTDGTFKELRAWDASDPFTTGARAIPNTSGPTPMAPETSINTTDKEGRVTGITIGGRGSAANAAARTGAVAEQNRRDRLADMDVTLAGMFYDADRLMKAYEKGGPGGLPGVIATGFDTALNSGRRTLSLMGIKVPALEEIERDPAAQELINLAGLKGRQRVAAYNLAVGIAGMSDRSTTGLSAKELAQIMDTLQPVFGGSPEVAMSTIREVISGAKAKRDSLATALGEAPWEPYEDQRHLLVPTEGEAPAADDSNIPLATEGDIQGAVRKQRFNKATGIWEDF